jgi:hypothetical protein
VLSLFVAALAAAGSPTTLESSVPWWEKITVTVDDKGKQQSCRYQVSLVPSATRACDPAIAASLKPDSDGRAGVYSKVTYERRFSPGNQLDSGRLQPGDTLLGRQVMFLTFDADGAIESCKVVATTGEMEFQYDCDQARKEQFKAQAFGSSARQAFLTVLAYGHSEHIA